jgi:hypothetical protein
MSEQMKRYAIVACLCFGVVAAIDLFRGAAAVYPGYAARQVAGTEVEGVTAARAADAADHFMWRVAVIDSPPPDAARVDPGRHGLADDARRWLAEMNRRRPGDRQDFEGWLAAGRPVKSPGEPPGPVVALCAAGEVFYERAPSAADHEAAVQWPGVVFASGQQVYDRWQALRNR